MIHSDSQPGWQLQDLASARWNLPQGGYVDAAVGLKVEIHEMRIVSDHSALAPDNIRSGQAPGSVARIHYQLRL
jgi:hypothetical protein